MRRSREIALIRWHNGHGEWIGFVNSKETKLSSAYNLDREYGSLSVHSRYNDLHWSLRGCRPRVKDTVKTKPQQGRRNQSQNGFRVEVKLHASDRITLTTHSPVAEIMRLPLKLGRKEDKTCPDTSNKSSRIRLCR